MHIKSTDIHKLSSLVYQAYNGLRKIKHPAPVVKDLIKNVGVLRNDIHSMHNDYDEPREQREVHDVEVDDHRFGLAFNFLHTTLTTIHKMGSLSDNMENVLDYLNQMNHIMGEYHSHDHGHEHHHSAPTKPQRKPRSKPRHIKGDGSPLHTHKK